VCVCVRARARVCV